MEDGGFTGGSPQNGSWKAPSTGCQGFSGGWTKTAPYEKIEPIETWADGCVGGSGYYQFFPDCNVENWVSWGYRIGGSSAASFKNCFGGNGGSGGKGGNITIDNISNVTALNGRFRQDKNDNRETTVLNQCVIYSQLGFSLDEINKDQKIYHTDLDCYQTYKNGDLEVAKVSDTLEYANNPEGMIIFLNNENPNYRTIDYDTYTKYGNLGIGSGAGLHEYSNGSLTISN